MKDSLVELVWGVFYLFCRKIWEDKKPEIIIISAQIIKMKYEMELNVWIFTHFHQLRRQVLVVPLVEIAESIVASLVEDLWLDFLVDCFRGFGFAGWNCVSFGSCHHGYYNYRCCSHCFDSFHYDCCCCNSFHCCWVVHGYNCRSCANCKKEKKKCVNQSTI